MNIQVYENNSSFSYIRDTLYLHRNYWDDYLFKTTFDVSYYDDTGKLITIGQVKIGYMGMKPKKSQISDSMITESISTFHTIPKEFSKLDDRFFSLGQDENYYVNISSLGDSKRIEVLTALQDVAFNLEHFKKVINEDSMKASLLRSVNANSVKEQLHRIADGGAKLTKYSFVYSTPSNESEETSSQLAFYIDPNSNPPTNIHVFIGRNGTGKTTLIKNMIHSIRYQDDTCGSFSYNKIGRYSNPAKFTNVLCVAFSPFDDFSKVDTQDTEIPYSYIGLNKHDGNLLDSIEMQFFEAFSNCMMNERKRQLWIKAIEILKSDITFGEMSLEAIAYDVSFCENNNEVVSEKKEYIKNIFSKLSSGHKVVLLIITGCVDKIVEKSIVFLDEPENHLHPPLLSALIRALSDLLIDRNGVAIISTHSPVVLQEVPTSCVYSIRRIDEKLIADRLPIKTFGASIGSLTNEVFGLEVTNSGYHKLIAEAVKKINDYEMISKNFDNQLGNEAIILLRTLLALNKTEDE